MDWTPEDNSQLCAKNSSLSACSPAYLTFLSFLVQYFGKSNDNYTGKEEKPESEQPEEYDFIIIGAGSAGCVLANRLSEIDNWKILLLEAGGQEPLIADVPSFAGYLRGTNVDWNFHTQPEKYSCRSKLDKKCTWTRGKMMGGSSSINYLMYIRGPARDFDNWEKLGNPGWSYKDVLPYFKKSEDNRTPQIVTANPGFHNTGGYLTVEHFPYTDPNAKVLTEAWQEIGYKDIDPNANEMIGSFIYQTTSRNGERLSTNGAFIRPIINQRSNLVIKTHAYVTKIVIDPDTKTATGVEYVLTESSDKMPIRAIAKKEVILSAGAINSPKILMLSGVGPKRELRKAKVKLIKKLSVGKNLQDHVTMIGLMIKMQRKSQTVVDFETMKNASLEYLQNRNNSISSMGVLSSGTFMKTYFERIPNYPDIQLCYDGINITDYLPVAKEDPNIGTLPLSYYNGINIRPVLLAPRSRGVVKLNPKNPIWGDPLIHPNYFTHPRDLNVLIAGIREIRKIFNTKIFKDNGFSLFDVPLPSCKKYKFDSDRYWKCLAIHYTGTIYHFSGTCKMGPISDPDAVVDSNLKVYGIEALRVVDASIMPVVTRGNTNAPTIMIAEKISDVIQKFWLKFGDK